MLRKLTLLLILPCLCFTARAQFDVRVNTFIQDDLRKGAPFYDIGSVSRFVPSVLHMGLGLAGVPSKHAFVDRALESTIAYTCSLSAGYLLKWAVARERPDHSDLRSMPSGHTLFAFTGAGLTGIDYGPGWAAGAYAVAVFTGAERLWGNRHWMTDVLAGAGIGILSAYAGKWLLQPVKDLFRIPDISWDGFGTRPAALSFVPAADPYSGTLCASLTVSF